MRTSPDDQSKSSEVEVSSKNDQSKDWADKLTARSRRISRTTAAIAFAAGVAVFGNWLIDDNSDSVAVSSASKTTGSEFNDDKPLLCPLEDPKKNGYVPCKDLEVLTVRFHEWEAKLGKSEPFHPDNHVGLIKNVEASVECSYPACPPSGPVDSVEGGLPKSEAGKGEVPLTLPENNYLVQAYNDQLRNNINEHGDSEIYFPTDVADLDQADGDDVCKLLIENRGARKFLVEGYADERGSQEHNKDLSASRAGAVKRRLLECASALNFEVPEVETAAFGSSELPEINYIDRLYARQGRAYNSEFFAELFAKQRRAYVSTKLAGITRGFDLLKGNIVLIDGSGGMRSKLDGTNLYRVGYDTNGKSYRLDKNKWELATEYKFPEGVEKLVFNSCQTEPVPLTKDAKPGCFSSLWTSVEATIDHAQKGQKITVVSDGRNMDGQFPTEDDVNQAAAKEIIAKARAKKLEISFVTLNAEAQTKDLLRTIVDATKGKIYSL